ncbi:MAG: sulfatase-like hydrolase/transferase [Lachnospiraceae bacterium]|nr:sulfatase-like hydrolase/transferase [Lachnospiraceae bacterium]
MGYPGGFRGLWLKTLTKNHIVFLCVYLEIVFHLLVFDDFNLMQLLLKLCASLTLGYILYAICSSFNNLTNKILTFVFAGIVSLYIISQYVYYKIFLGFFTYSLAEGVGVKVLEFFDVAIRAVGKNFISILLLAFPLILMIVLSVFYTDFSRKKAGSSFVNLSLGIVFMFIFNLVMITGGSEEMSVFKDYHEYSSVESAFKNCGMMVGLKCDLKQSFFNNKNEDELIVEINIPKPKNTKTPTPTPTITSTPTPSPTEMPRQQIVDENGVVVTATPTPTSTSTPTPTPTKDYSPNVMDIDFEWLAENEDNKVFKNILQYFAYREPTNRNDYTGMFNGYNLIFITAEGWSPFAVREDLTPTLYSMIHDGFYFEDYYNPIWLTSTSDGEFAGISGLIPSGQHSMRHTGDNAMPFALGNMLKNSGYSTYAYHNNDYDYYKRNFTHPNLGYDIFRARYGKVIYGVDTDTFKEDSVYDKANPDAKRWAYQSDLELMQYSVDEYIDEYLKTGKPFHTYYMTMSGHLPYSCSGNKMVKKHWDMVKDLPLSDTSKAYLACNYELELAMKYLVERLEEAGILDKTLIVLNSDHYPYGLKEQAETDKSITGGNGTYYMSELAGREIDSKFEMFKNHLIIWSGSMKEPVVVSKTCSSIDIMPTVLNLLGITYDSRVYPGNDVFSDAKELVIFKNNVKANNSFVSASFITEDYMYYVEDGEKLIIPRKGIMPSAEEVNAMAQEISNLYRITYNIIEFESESDYTKFTRGDDVFSKILPYVIYEPYNTDKRKFFTDGEWK